MAKTRSREKILEEIAKAKERRSQTIIAVSPSDDARAGLTHPDVTAIDAELRKLRSELDAASLDA